MNIAVGVSFSGRRRGAGLAPYGRDMIAKFLVGLKDEGVATVEFVHAFLNRCPQALKFGGFFGVALLQKPEALADNLAGVLIAAGGHVLSHQLYQVVGQ